MTIEELKSALRAINEDASIDIEDSHIKADRLLIEFIGDEEVARLYGDIEKWYA